MEQVQNWHLKIRNLILTGLFYIKSGGGSMDQSQHWPMSAKRMIRLTLSGPKGRSGVNWSRVVRPHSLVWLFETVPPLNRPCLSRLGADSALNDFNFGTVPPCRTLSTFFGFFFTFGSLVTACNDHYQCIE